jgi:DNA-binding NtrC family response regulator
MQPSRKGILCLCHDETMLQLRQMLLERFGYKVWSTSSVEDAKNIAVDSCPDMLLMDHNYPGVDSEKVAEQLKKSCPELIAVVLSPYFSVRNASHSAVDRFVPRDEAPDAMIERIEELFEIREGEATNPHARRAANGGPSK